VYLQRKRGREEEWERGRKEGGRGREERRESVCEWIRRVCERARAQEGARGRQKKRKRKRERVFV